MTPSQRPAQETHVRATRDWAPALQGLFLRWGILAVLFGLIVYLSMVQPQFLTITNWTNLIRDMSVETLVALAVTVSVVVAGFDVSVGAVAGMAVIVSMMAMVVYHASAAEAVGLSLLSGLVIGAVNAFLIVRLRLPDLLATLGMLFVVDGVQQVFVAGQTITPGMTLPNGSSATGTIQPSFLAIDQGRFLHLPISIWIMFAVAMLLWFFLSSTRVGRLMYAVGSNQEAARLSGVNVGAYKTGAYLLSGFLAALGGVVLAARIGVGEQLAGDPYMLNGVAASMIGFAVLGSGRANVFGTFIGALLMAVMVNGFTMLNVPYYTQQAMLGAVMLAALALSYAVKSRG
ncbi:MAG: ABC transporter permease [Firmicutes bacterium]|nr:ABC transporter permease [Bacillota bacterium]